MPVANEENSAIVEKARADFKSQGSTLFFQPGIEKSFFTLYYGMKKIFCKILVSLLMLLASLSWLLILAMVFEPIGKVVFSISLGARYQKAGETVLKTPEAVQTLSIYKAANKPFLLVGPCLFHEGEDYVDFFFVNPTQVIRTGTDKGGDMWVRLFKWLYMMDDLSDCECLRAPWWNDLNCSPEASVRQEKLDGVDVYRFKIRINQKTTPAFFAIPAALFTPDMLNAPNATQNKSNTASSK